MSLVTPSLYTGNSKQKPPANNDCNSMRKHYGITVDSA